ncbi:MAG: hypothetical protein JNM63_17205 [Spirochaetia bacterium]|nr:hypothetical protein [Spirochaetia bacterium]
MLFLQSTVYYSLHFSFIHVKPNLVFVIVLLAAATLDVLPALIFTALAGLCLDHLSSAPPAFYLFSYFFSLLPIQLFRGSFSFQILPVFMLLVLALTLFKSLIEAFEVFFIVGFPAAFTYFKNIAFLEIIQNTLLSVPILLIYKIVTGLLHLRKNK